MAPVKTWDVEISRDTGIQADIRVLDDNRNPIVYNGYTAIWKLMSRRNGSLLATHTPSFIGGVVSISMEEELFSNFPSSGYHEVWFNPPSQDSYKLVYGNFVLVD